MTLLHDNPNTDAPFALDPDRPSGRRVLLVTHRFPPDAVGGVELYTQTLAEELVRSGDVVAVVSARPDHLRPRPEPRVELHQAGMPVYRIVGGPDLRRSFMSGTNQFDALFEQVLAEFEPDVVHFNHLIDLSPSMMEIARSYGAAVVLTLHDYYAACPRVTLQQPGGALCDGPGDGRKCKSTCFAESTMDDAAWTVRADYFRRLLEVPHQVVCPSQFLETYFQNFSNHASIRTVSNAVWVDRPAAASELPRPSDAPLRLAFMGALLPHKGMHVIIEALALSGLANVELNIFGPSDDPGYLRSILTRAARLPGV